MEFDHCSSCTRTSNRLVIVAIPICSNRFLTAGVPSQQQNNTFLLLRVVKDKLPAVWFWCVKSNTCCKLLFFCDLYRVAQEKSRGRKKSSKAKSPDRRAKVKRPKNKSNSEDRSSDSSSSSESSSSSSSSSSEEESGSSSRSSGSDVPRRWLPTYEVHLHWFSSEARSAKDMVFV